VISSRNAGEASASTQGNRPRAGTSELLGSVARWLGRSVPADPVHDAGPDLRAQVRRLEIRARRAMESGSPDATKALSRVADSNSKRFANIASATTSGPSTGT